MIPESTIRVRLWTALTNGFVMINGEHIWCLGVLDAWGLWILGIASRAREVDPQQVAAVPAPLMRRVTQRDAQVPLGRRRLNGGTRKACATRGSLRWLGSVHLEIPKIHGNRFVDL